MSELEIVMAYTGWSTAIATAAIKQWKQYDPDWNAYYILEYLEEVKGNDQELAVQHESGSE